MATQSSAQTGELTSQVLANANPFEVISRYNPAKQSTAVLVEVNQMIGTSFKEFFEKAARWILELKNNRFKVRPGSKGVQIEINGIPTYWHEFFDETFGITRRHFQQLEKQVTEGTWQGPALREGDRVQIEVEGKDKEGRVVKVDETAEKIDVQPLAEPNEPLGKTYEVITLDFEGVEKVKPAKVMKVMTGQLLLLTDLDGGTEYRYEGGGRIKRTGKPSLNAQRKAEEDEAERRREANLKEKREKEERAEREKKAEALRGAEATVKKISASDIAQPMVEEPNKMHPAAADLKQTLDSAKPTPHGYFAKLNRKPKNATQEAQPWEIYKNVSGAKPEFCCRERGKQDAEAQMWKLERMADEEAQTTTTTTTNNETAEAAAM